MSAPIHGTRHSATYRISGEAPSAFTAAGDDHLFMALPPVHDHLRLDRDDPLTARHLHVFKDACMFSTKREHPMVIRLGPESSDYSVNVTEFEVWFNKTILLPPADSQNSSGMPYTGTATLVIESAGPSGAAVQVAGEFTVATDLFQVAASVRGPEALWTDVRLSIKYGREEMFSGTVSWHDKTELCTFRTRPTEKPHRMPGETVWRKTHTGVEIVWPDVRRTKTLWMSRFVPQGVLEDADLKGIEGRGVAQ